jgi:hypothetical protein
MFDPSSFPEQYIVVVRDVTDHLACDRLAVPENYRRYRSVTTQFPDRRHFDEPHAV